MGIAYVIKVLMSGSYNIAPEGLPPVLETSPTGKILTAWRDGCVRLVVSKEILQEYREVAKRLRKDFPMVDATAWLSYMEGNAMVVEAPPLPERVCSDPDDDMFLACAKAARATLICSGDKALLATSGYCGIEVLKPRDFVQRYLK